MRDGSDLSADVFLPAREGIIAEGRFPCILLRTLNNRGDVGKGIDHQYFVKRGYAVVIENCRGRFESDGEFHHGILEMEDGHDTIEWIAKQPWSSGKIGTTGRCTALREMRCDPPAGCPVPGVARRAVRGGAPDPLFAHPRVLSGRSYEDRGRCVPRPDGARMRP